MEKINYGSYIVLKEKNTTKRLYKKLKKKTNYAQIRLYIGKILFTKLSRIIIKVFKVFMDICNEWLQKKNRKRKGSKEILDGRILVLGVKEYLRRLWPVRWRCCR